MGAIRSDMMRNMVAAYRHLARVNEDAMTEMAWCRDEEYSVSAEQSENFGSLNRVSGLVLAALFALQRAIEFTGHDDVDKVCEKWPEDE